VQLLERQFVTEIDGVCENLSVRACVALDDDAIQPKITPPLRRFQLFLRVFVPLAFTCGFACGVWVQASDTHATASAASAVQRSNMTGFLASEIIRRWCASLEVVTGITMQF
jgi:hypothetical protein